MKLYRFLTLKRHIFLPVLVATICLPLAAQDSRRTAPRIAVLDFTVESNNPDYEFLGKGLAEFIAVELAGIEGVTIIDRERRNAIIEEQKFGLSGLADEEKTVELGKILSANYLLSGSIFDMFGNLEVTVQLVDAETGSSASSAQAGGEPKEYKKIVAELAGKVALSLDLTEAEVPVKVAAADKPLDNEEADVVLSSFSKAVEAVDKNDVAAAKKNLQAAQKIDKDNKAVTYYLNKLFTASPKFNVELISYAPSYNPATLGFVDKDRMYSTVVNNGLHPTYKNPNVGHGDGEPYNWELRDGLYYSLVLVGGSIGYYFPLGERLGMGAEFAASRVESDSLDYTYNLLSGTSGAFRRVSALSAIMGGRLSLGIKLTDNIGIGFSGYGYYSNNELPYGIDGNHIKSNNVNGSVTFGLNLRFLNSNLIVETHATAAFLQEVYLDYTIKDYVAYKTAPSPIAVETSVIGKLIGGRLNLSLKNISEIYFSFGEDDRSGLATRIIPAVEWWPVNFLSIRAGGEYDLLALNSMDTPTGGFGALGGLSFRIGPVDIDVNYTYMQRVMRFYPGLSGPDHVLLVQASWNGAFIKERKQ